MTPATKNKIIAVVLIAAAIGLFLLGRSCGITSVLKQKGSDTTITKDSIVYRYKPYPYKVIDVDTFTIAGKTKYLTDLDTLSDLYILVEPVDTAQILADYNSFVLYEFDTAWRGGSLILSDTLHQNRIFGRQLKLNTTDSFIRETIVLKPPRRTVGYFNLAAIGNPGDPIAGYGAGFSLKNRNDFVYSFGARKLQWSKKLFYELQLDFPIRLSPKK